MSREIAYWSSVGPAMCLQIEGRLGLATCQTARLDQNLGSGDLQVTLKRAEQSLNIIGAL
jgi:hypothetical protein